MKFIRFPRFLSLAVAALAATCYASFALAADGGSVAGSVQFKGTPPKPTPVANVVDPTCAGHAAKLCNENVVVNENNTLRNVMVYVKGDFDGQEFDAPKEPATISQVECQFSPRVVGVRVGQKLKVTNTDSGLHNVHGHPDQNPEFNIAQPTKGFSNNFTFKAAEPGFPIKCDVHPWMKAWCWVFNHPYFCVSGKDGAFSIANLPPGDYTLVAWHEYYGTQEQKVTVAAGKKAEVQFTFDAASRK
jgi:plastocyanin